MGETMPILISKRYPKANPERGKNILPLAPDSANALRFPFPNPHLLEENITSVIHATLRARTLTLLLHEPPIGIGVHVADRLAKPLLRDLGVLWVAEESTDLATELVAGVKDWYGIVGLAGERDR